jgi:signal transduction histidine kinase
MRWPLRLQILTPMAVILVVTVGCVSALNAWLAAARVRAEVEGQLRDVAATLEKTNFPLESNVLQQASALCGAQLLILDETGRPLASSLSEPWTGPPPAPVTNWRELRLRESVAMGGSLAGELHFTAGVKLDRRAVGGRVVELFFFYPERTWREATRQAALGPLVIGLVALVLVGAAAWWVAASVTSPVHRLQEQLHKLTAGNYQSIPLPRRDDEIRDLAAAVNELARQLAQYEEEVRGNERLRTLAHLGSGIAHQVRNAATGCRIAIDLYERDHSENGGKLADDRLQIAKRQLSLIETHIQRLLALGKPSTPVRERLELAGLLEDTLELVRPTADHLGVELKSPADWPNAAGEGDGEALQQMLVNLLINAIQAVAPQAATSTAEGAPPPCVTLEASLSGSTLTIAIIDNGPGMPDHVAAKLFQPFQSNKPGGTGLGLSVARQTARLHGGEIRWRREDGQTRFWVELPDWHGWDSHC